MKARRLSTGSGTTIALGTELGKGGEGTVYQVVGAPDLVAKLYGRAEPRRAKVEAMVAAGLHRQAQHISFPIDVLLDETRSFVGFTMRRVRGAWPIHQLWNSRDRRDKFPDATVSFMVRVAANAARTVADLHHTGCVIGDINESGFLVTDKAIVILIDSDSIQYAAGGSVFPCVVGTFEYLPPEHQGINQRNLGTRNPNHDNFGLAVLIFRLLMNGTHPFGGVWKGSGDPTRPERIKDFRYAYGADSAKLKVAPQPTAPPIDWLPDDLRSAFERAFGKSGVKHRPTAREWIDRLCRLESELAQCGKSRFHHHRPGARSCPWCETEKKQGRELFGKVQTNYQQAKMGSFPRPSSGPGSPGATAALPRRPPRHQSTLGNGLRIAVLAIIGIAVVLLWEFVRSNDSSNFARQPIRDTRQPVVQHRNALGTVKIIHSSRGTQNCAKKYGAIAYSPNRRELSSTADQCSENSARKMVSNVCSRRASDCRTGAFWGSYCAALAYTPNGGWGMAVGPNSTAAGSEATKACKQSNPRDTCQVRSTVCNSYAEILKLIADGVWSGPVSQPSSRTSYSMRLRQEGDEVTVDYPALSCGGIWELSEVRGEVAVFRERIRYGQNRCTNNGYVFLSVTDQKQIHFEYTNASSQISASATLHRNSALDQNLVIRTISSGIWSGSVYQPSSRRHYSIQIRSKNDTINVDYPELSCGGVWQLDSSRGGATVLRERIRYGQNGCINNGFVFLRMYGRDRVFFEYRVRTNGEVIASALLSRTR